MLKTTIFVEPVAKARARTVIKGGRVMSYTPHKTVKAEAAIRAAIYDKVDYFYKDIPLYLEATFYRPRPKSLVKRIVLPVQRPDIDNYTKLLTDALEKFVYANDSQITSMLVRKRFGLPRIELVITEDIADVKKEET